ncbi:hypothetical protein EON80_08705 [bacterium]|nr:MAG: hypothetical protein EON80_08705 [bacterium]
MIARNATLSPSLWLVSLYAAFSPSSQGVKLAEAAPVTSTGVSALTFNVTARLSAGGPASGPQQTIQARVLLSGKAARIETTTAGTPAVVLFTPPYVYRLLPSAKAGVRWKLKPQGGSNLDSLDPQTFLRDPAKLKAELVKGGAKKTGTGVLSKAPVDIYEAKNFKQQGQRVKVWLRSSDSLPLRLETSGSQYKIVASWRDYARPKNLPAALFKAPTGFRVREAQGEPPFSAL